MHTVLNVTVGAFVHLIGWVSTLSTILADVARRPPLSGDYALAAVVASSILVALGCFAWAVIVRTRAEASRQAMSLSLAHAQAEVRLREAMIGACPESIAVLGTDLMSPLSYRGGGSLLQACLGGPDSTALAVKLDALLQGGTAFSLSVRTASHSCVGVRGCAVGSRAAVFLHVEETGLDWEPDYRAVLDALPVPVWTRNRNLALSWANRAFLAATDMPTLKDALAANALLERSERDLARAASEGNDVVAAKRYVAIGGRRKALAIDLTRLPGASILGIATDITAVVEAEARLQQEQDATADVMDRIDTAVAIFGADQRLVTHNGATARLWGLAEDWLQTHPTLGDILDRLREMRRLPEQRDFSAWKREQLEPFGPSGRQIQETWHSPGGNSVEVKTYPTLPGGVVYLFEDIAERLRLESSYNMLAQMQRATLNTVEDAMAIFGLDGRLKLHNDAFARLWKMSEEELSGQPHLSKVAELCAAQLGQDGIWNIVAAGVNSAEPARYGEWGKTTRADGRILSLSLARLPLGATLVTFTDLTDIKRFETGLSEKPSSAA